MQPCFTKCLYFAPSHDQIIVYCVGYTTLNLSTHLQLDIRVAASFGLLKYGREFVGKSRGRHELRIARFRGRLLDGDPAMLCLPSGTHSFRPLALKCPPPQLQPRRILWVVIASYCSDWVVVTVCRSVVVVPSKSQASLRQDRPYLGSYLFPDDIGKWTLHVTFPPSSWRVSLSFQEAARPLLDETVLDALAFPTSADCDMSSSCPLSPHQPGPFPLHTASLLLLVCSLASDYGSPFHNFSHTFVYVCVCLCLLLWFVYFFFKTGFFSVALDLLKLSLQTRLAENSKFHLPLSPKYWD